MLLATMLVCMIMIVIVMIMRDDRRNRPEHYAAKRARKRARRVARRGRARASQWDADLSRANLEAIYEATRGLPDDVIRDLSATMLGGLAGVTSQATWARALALVPVPCRVRVSVSGRIRRCSLTDGHDGPHQLDSAKRRTA